MLVGEYLWITYCQPLRPEEQPGPSMMRERRCGTISRCWEFLADHRCRKLDLATQDLPFKPPPASVLPSSLSGVPFSLDFLVVALPSSPGPTNNGRQRAHAPLLHPCSPFPLRWTSRR